VHRKVSSTVGRRADEQRARAEIGVHGPPVHRDNEIARRRGDAGKRPHEHARRDACAVRAGVRMYAAVTVRTVRTMSVVHVLAGDLGRLTESL
jgi:hypothetical protein